MNRHLWTALAFVLVGVALIAGVAWLSREPRSVTGGPTPAPVYSTPSGTTTPIIPPDPFIVSCSHAEGGRGNPTTGLWECPPVDLLKEVRRLRARLVILERREALDREYRRHLVAQGLTARIQHVPVR